jgi:hypothetical protein
MSERRVVACDLVWGSAMRTPHGKFEGTKPLQRLAVSQDCRPNRAATVRARVRQHALFLIRHGNHLGTTNRVCIKDYRSRGSTGRAQGLPPLFTGYVQDIIGQLISGVLRAAGAEVAVAVGIDAARRNCDDMRQKTRHATENVVAPALSKEHEGYR